MVREEKFQEDVEQMKAYKADALFLNEKLNDPFPVYKWILGKNVFETEYDVFDDMYKIYLRDITDNTEHLYTLKGVKSYANKID